MIAADPAPRHLHDRAGLGWIRRVELDAVKPWFESGQRVLELGGGSGHQARLLASWGCDVSSIDIVIQDDRELHFPVQWYDGRNIPFDDGEFDVVFSSNVLEHIQDLPQVLAETRRVLKRDGVAVHVLPTPVWRAATHVERYVVWLQQRLAPASGAVAGPEAPTLTWGQKGGLGGFLRRAILGDPHGEYSSALAELYYFSTYRWNRVFRASGFSVVRVDGGPLFYSGFGLVPVVRIGARRRIARRLASSAQILIVRRMSTRRSTPQAGPT